MKIMAQSIVPARPSYLHLGYLAAGTTLSYRPYGSIALGMMVLGVLVMTRLRVIRTAGKLDIRPALRSRPVWIGGSVVALAGALLLWAGPSKETRLPTEYTDYSMRFAATLIRGEHQVSGSASAALEATADRCREMEDGWYHKLSVCCVSQTPLSYEVRSAGPDGRFETPDDIVQQVPLPATQAAPRQPESTGQPGPG